MQKMSPNLALVRILIAGSVIIISQYVPSVTCKRDDICWTLFSKTEANAFLPNGKRSTPKECCDESICESRGDQCYTEQYRQYIKTMPEAVTCSKPGQAVAVTSWCPGHYGTVCKDICSVLGRNQCENGGTCVPKGMTWQCNCRSGFSGTICQVDVDECSSNPCNAATSTSCDNLIGDYFCHCSAGYTGKNCKIDINECSSSPCRNGGSCVDHVAKYSCRCMPGYSGYQCQNDICRVSGRSRCENGGTCVHVGNSWRCNCRPGFTGTVCQVDIDECASNPCNSITTARCQDLINDYYCHCSAGYTGKNCSIDINECSSSPCQNGGKCLDQVARFSCVCVAGYTGSQCEYDIDECASSPCKNNATCNNMVNRYTCNCPPRIYGVNCDTNICHPTPADVVFVLDSSFSMTESQFRKQLEFVANFTDHVIIGPRDFQVSVITYSFNATIEFYLNEYTDNVTLKDAIMNITFKTGATFTDKGLKEVVSLFSPGHGGDKSRVNNTMATRFVFLLTDGMSTDRHNTRAAARHLKKVVDKITVIGIGNQVSHQELLDIATCGDGSSSLPANVYSVANFNSLYTVVKQLVHYDCDECAHSSLSDVSIVIDKSHYISHAQYQSCLNAVDYLIDLLHLGSNKTHISVTAFDTAITELILFGDAMYSTTKIKAKVNRQMKSEEKSQLEMSDVLDHVGSNIVGSSRPHARKFLLIFSNGRFNVNAVNLQTKVAMLESKNVTIFAIGSGNNVSVEGLMPLVSDPFHVFLTGDSQTNLDVLRSEFLYNTCDLKGE